MARKQGADIYFGDAAHIRSDHHAGRTWGAKGDTPIVQATGARHGMSLISAVTSRGHLRFMIIDKGSVNADVFIEFLKRLIKGAEREIFFDSRSRLSSSREESQRFRAHAGREIALVLSASLFTGPQPRRVGVEASESGYRRPHGDDQQSRFHEEGSPLDARFAK